jgi:hypothetical protein
MEDKGLGNIIFYIILAVIALAGSFSNKKKKTGGPGAPTKTFSWPDLEGEEPAPVSQYKEPESEPVPSQRPVVINEGRYEEPMAGAFSDEGSYVNPMAERFSSEGTVSNDLASAFSNEGSIANSMASAFATEGMSGMNEEQIRMSTDSTISDHEIGDAEAFDYEAYKTELTHEGGFNLRKAVIYSALLNRKEYTF